MATFDEAITAIKNEREYQKAKWGQSSDEKQTTPVLAFTALIQSYLDEARELQARNPHTSDITALTGAAIRKLTALGVACMEAHGVVERDGK